MKKNKNIDELFKERFKNFEATPSPDVWNKIQAKLKEKDDRKVIPLWIKLGGVAALFALIFTIGNSLLNVPLNKINAPIVNENPAKINSESHNNIIVANNDVIQDEIVLTENKNEVKRTNEVLIKKSSTATNNSNRVRSSETTVVSNSKNSRVSKKQPQQHLIQDSKAIIKGQETVAKENANLADKTKDQLINKDSEINKNIEAVAVNENIKDTSENPSSTEKKKLLRKKTKNLFSTQYMKPLKSK